MWFFRSANNISTTWRKLHVCSEIAFQREDVITVRNEVTKVMFLHLSVILFTGGGLPQYMLGYHPPGPGTPPQRADPPRLGGPRGQTPPRADHPQTRHPPEQTLPEQTPPRADTHPPRPDTLRSRQPPRADTPPADGYCCGRYASYWNAFLLKFYNYKRNAFKIHTIQYKTN